MIDVVYFTSNYCNYYRHEEMRYSLRSLEKHLVDYQEVYVIGEHPGWIKNINFLAEKDIYKRNKDANIIMKMHVACLNSEISDLFIFVNDDHYLTQDVKAREFPFYHKGQLIGNSPSWTYKHRINNTRNLLDKRGLPTLNYDIHTPILIEKDKFIKIFSTWHWNDEEGPGIVMKSVYANSLNVEGIEMEDWKIAASEISAPDALLAKANSRPCFSLSNRVNNRTWQLLRVLYPKPSRYEK